MVKFIIDIELREELKAKGHIFVTQTDTEVIIEAYKEWGFECLQKFNGMFAFVLLIKKQSNFLRKRWVGVKPFIILIQIMHLHLLVNIKHSLNPNYYLLKLMKLNSLIYC